MTRSTLCPHLLTTTTHANRLYVALELSRAKWLVAVYAVGDEKPHVHEIRGRDTTRLQEIIADRSAALQRRTQCTVDVLTCFEAGYDGFWLHRFLTARGIQNFVLDGASILVDRRAKQVKTDRIDVLRLLRALMGYATGDHANCRVVHVPTPEQEDERRISRERNRSVRERTGHINRIRGLLTSEGVHVASIKDGRWVNQLDAMKTGDGRPLPGRLAAELRREWERLLVVKEQLREVEAERDDIAYGRTKHVSVDAEKIHKLIKLRGIGPDFATLLTREVFFREFRNRSAVAKYFGLAPAPFSSGDSHRDQGIDKAGNVRARCAAVEAAWMWIRHQPASALSKWYLERTRNAQSRMRRVTIVALARKLMVALWRYVETNVAPQGAVLKA
jgi:transposase